MTKKQKLFKKAFFVMLAGIIMISAPPVYSEGDALHAHTDENAVIVTAPVLLDRSALVPIEPLQNPSRAALYSVDDCEHWDTYFIDYYYIHPHNPRYGCNDCGYILWNSTATYPGNYEGCTENTAILNVYWSTTGSDYTHLKTYTSTEIAAFCNNYFTMVSEHGTPAGYTFSGTSYVTDAQGTGRTAGSNAIVYYNESSLYGHVRFTYVPDTTCSHTTVTQSEPSATHGALGHTVTVTCTACNHTYTTYTTVATCAICFPPCAHSFTITGSIDYNHTAGQGHLTENYCMDCSTVIGYYYTSYYATCPVCNPSVCEHPSVTTSWVSPEHVNAMGGHIRYRTCNVCNSQLSDYTFLDCTQCSQCHVYVDHWSDHILGVGHSNTVSCAICSHVSSTYVTHNVPSAVSSACDDCMNYTSYLLKNVGTNTYLTVHMGNDQDGQNIHVAPRGIYGSTGTQQDSQGFKLKYHAQRTYSDGNFAENVFTLNAVCSQNGNDRVVNIARNSAALAAGQNAQLHTTQDVDATSFRITQLANGYYRLEMAKDPTLVLTANTGAGTGTGTASSSAGNVYIDTYSGYNVYQQWILEPCTEENDTVGPIDTGSSYYIVMRNSGDMLSSQGTLTYSLYSTTGSNTQRQWTFTQIAGTTNVYAIHPASNPNLAITIYPDTYFDLLDTCQVDLDTYNASNTNQYWRIAIDGGNVTMTSQSTDANANGMRLTEVLQASRKEYTPIDLTKVSSLVPCTDISVASGNMMARLEANADFPNVSFSPSNATHASIEWLEIVPNDICATDTNEHKIRGKKMGAQLVTVRHKIFKDVSDTIWISTTYPTISIKYDNAFTDVASTELLSNVTSKISSWMSTVQDVYYDRFGLQLSYSIDGLSPSLPETASHGCGADRDSFCDLSFTGTDCYNTHHKNYYNIIDAYAYGSSSSINLYFSGQANCGEYEHPITEVKSHLQHRALGVASLPLAGDLIGKKAVVFVNEDNGNDNIDGKILKTLVHELGHNFSVQDHYDTSYIDDHISGHSDDCIWGQNRNNPFVYNNLLMCSYCTSVLENYIDSLYVS